MWLFNRFRWTHSYYFVAETTSGSLLRCVSSLWMVRINLICGWGWSTSNVVLCRIYSWTLHQVLVLGLTFRWITSHRSLLTSIARWDYYVTVHRNVWSIKNLIHCLLNRCGLLNIVLKTVLCCLCCDPCSFYSFKGLRCSLIKSWSTSMAYLVGSLLIFIRWGCNSYLITWTCGEMKTCTIVSPMWCRLTV